MNDMIRDFIALMEENSLTVLAKTFVSRGYLVRVSINHISTIEDKFKILSTVSYVQEKTGGILYGEVHKLNFEKGEITIRWNDVLSDKSEEIDISIFPFDYALKKLKVHIK